MRLVRRRDVEEAIRVQLTEGFMMEPAASVSDAEQLARSVRAAEGAVVA